MEQPAAACLMVRRRTFDQVGGMDERFFPAWFEDVDLCRRILEAGWTIFFVPRANFRHQGGSSVATLGVARMKRLYYRNLERYMAKHHGLARPRRHAVADRHRAWGLRVAGSALVGNGDGMRTYGGVMKAALKRLRKECQTPWTPPFEISDARLRALCACRPRRVPSARARATQAAASP